MKKRSIMCVDHNEMALSDLRCNADTRPIDIELCGKSIPYCNSDDDNNENNIIDSWNNIHRARINFTLPPPPLKKEKKTAESIHIYI